VQIFKPQIEKTRLEYIKHDELILRIFERVEKQTLQTILTEDGTPDVDAINRWVRFQGTFLNRLKVARISLFDLSSSITTCELWYSLRELKKTVTCYMLFSIYFHKLILLRLQVHTLTCELTSHGQIDFILFYFIWKQFDFSLSFAIEITHI